MSEEKILAILCAAERLGIMVLEWMPYSDELPEHAMAKWQSDQAKLKRDLDFVRSELDKQKEAVLNIAEHRGSK